MRSAFPGHCRTLAFTAIIATFTPLAHAAEDEDEAIPPPLPPAADTLSGHFVLGGSGGLTLPFGSLQDNLRQRQILGTGFELALDIGYGVSRTVAAGAWLELAGNGAGSGCDECDSSAQAAGLFVRYHIVQGVRFDPWISAGAGYRRLGITAGDLDLEYSGIELLNLAVGGDWYAFKSFGFGPFLRLETTMLTSRPAEASELEPRSTNGSALSHNFSLGLRLVLDVPGK